MPSCVATDDLRGLLDLRTSKPVSNDQATGLHCGRTISGVTIRIVTECDGKSVIAFSFHFYANAGASAPTGSYACLRKMPTFYLQRIKRIAKPHAYQIKTAITIVEQRQNIELVDPSLNRQ